MLIISLGFQDRAEEMITPEVATQLQDMIGLVNDLGSGDSDPEQLQSILEALSNLGPGFITSAIENTPELQGLDIDSMIQGLSSLQQGGL